MHIAIAGNIGAGKTTLTKLLSKHYRWQAHYEEVLENPYLDDFYHEMERWSFNLQIYLIKMNLYLTIYLANTANSVMTRKSVPDNHIFTIELS